MIKQVLQAGEGQSSMDEFPREFQKQAKYFLIKIIYLENGFRKKQKLSEKLCKGVLMVPGIPSLEES